MTLKTKLIRGLSNVQQTVGKHSPLILTAVGVVGLGATAVYSYKAAKKMEVVVEELEEANEKGIEPDRVEVGKKVISALALPVTLGVASIAAIGFSYWIQNNRITTLAATVTTLVAEHQYYKNKFKDEYGEEEQKKFYQPVTTVVTKVENENGEVEDHIEQLRNELPSLTGVWFDKSTEYVSDDHAYNMRFIRSSEDNLSSKLFATGWLRMNEVFDKLGLERTRGGELFGWNTRNGFNIDTIVTNVRDQVTGEITPQIFMKWSRPVYIYDDVEYKWS